MPGATGPTLTLKNITAKHAGLYSVMVYNNVGSTNSAPAALEVVSTPAATLDSSATISGHFSFNVVGVTDYKYAVESSSDLIHWTRAQTNAAPFTFVDPQDTQLARKFYRTVYVH
jgi:hypothetical protein